MRRELRDAYAIVERVAPGRRPEAACMLVAAAIGGMRGLTIRHIKVGALFWPERFEAEGDTQLAISGGWGIYSYSPSTGEVALHSQELHDDGGFCGHTWLQDDRGLVIDLMHDVDGGPVSLYRKHRTIATWFRRPKLESRVKAYWRLEIRAAMKEGRLLTKNRAKEREAARVRKAARRMEEETNGNA